MGRLEGLEIDFSRMNEYNNIPVVYCKHCLSLAIRSLEEDSDFCDKCGNTETEKTDIFTWEKMYEEKYNTKFINK